MNDLMKVYRTNGLTGWPDFDAVMNSFFTDTPVWNARVPAVDVREEDDRYVLEAELPGLTEKDVEVKIEDTLLTILSSKKAEDETGRGGFLIRERNREVFQRTFVLPKDVDREQVEAKFKNGLLFIELKKSPERQPKTIEIKSA